jgi:hypothetical protein
MDLVSGVADPGRQRYWRARATRTMAGIVVAPRALRCDVDRAAFQQPARVEGGKYSVYDRILEGNRNQIHVAREPSQPASIHCHCRGSRVRAIRILVGLLPAIPWPYWRSDQRTAHHCSGGCPDRRSSCAPNAGARRRTDDGFGRGKVQGTHVHPRPGTTA